MEEDLVTKKIIEVLKKGENFCDRTKEENILVKGYTYKDGLLFFKIGKRHLNEGEIRIFIPITFSEENIFYRCVSHISN